MATTLADAFPSALVEAGRATAQFALPFRAQAWRGQMGNWAGSGIGSSIDFQDHRQYLPGDDPRYINWQAYARTGHYSMKLYREEVSPRVDLALDVSPSMSYDSAKAARSLELFAFAALSTLQSSAQLAAFTVAPAGVVPVRTEDLRTGQLPMPADEANVGPPRAPAWERVPWRPQALRVLVSDLLFPGEPTTLGHLLTASRSRALLLVPWTAAEADPDWLGQCELIECEGGARYPQNVSAPDLARYHQRYREHFSAWRDTCQRLAIAITRVRATGTLSQALLADAIPAQAIELRDGR